MENLKTEYNVKEENEDDYNQHKKRNLLLRNIQTTSANHYKVKSAAFDFFFLDYAFREKKNLISKAKNKVNLTNYCYELENTISINLEILLSFMDNSKTNNNKKIVISYDNKSRDTSDTNSSITPYMIIIMQLEHIDSLEIKNILHLKQYHQLEIRKIDLRMLK